MYLRHRQTRVPQLHIAYYPQKHTYPSPRYSNVLWFRMLFVKQFLQTYIFLAVDAMLYIQFSIPNKSFAPAEIRWRQHSHPPLALDANNNIQLKIVRGNYNGI